MAGKQSWIQRATVWRSGIRKDDGLEPVAPAMPVNHRVQPFRQTEVEVPPTPDRLSEQMEELESKARQFQIQVYQRDIEILEAQDQKLAAEQCLAEWKHLWSDEQEELNQRVKNLEKEGRRATIQAAQFRVALEVKSGLLEQRNRDIDNLRAQITGRQKVARGFNATCESDEPKGVVETLLGDAENLAELQRNELARLTRLAESQAGQIKQAELQEGDLRNQLADAKQSTLDWQQTAQQVQAKQAKKREILQEVRDKIQFVQEALKHAEERVAESNKRLQKRDEEAASLQSKATELDDALQQERENLRQIRKERQEFLNANHTWKERHASQSNRLEVRRARIVAALKVQRDLGEKVENLGNKAVALVKAEQLVEQRETEITKLREQVASLNDSHKSLEKAIDESKQEQQRMLTDVKVTSDSFFKKEQESKVVSKRLDMAILESHDLREQCQETEQRMLSLEQNHKMDLERLSAVSGELEAVQLDASDLSKQRREALAQIHVLEGDLHASRDQLSQGQAQIEFLSSELEAVQGKLKQQSQDLEKTISVGDHQAAIRSLEKTVVDLESTVEARDKAVVEAQVALNEARRDRQAAAAELKTVRVEEGVLEQRNNLVLQLTDQLVESREASQASAEKAIALEQEVESLTAQAAGQKKDYGSTLETLKGQLAEALKAGQTSAGKAMALGQEIESLRTQTADQKRDYGSSVETLNCQLADAEQRLSESELILKKARAEAEDRRTQASTLQQEMQGFASLLEERDTRIVSLEEQVKTANFSEKRLEKQLESARDTLGEMVAQSESRQALSSKTEIQLSELRSEIDKLKLLAKTLEEEKTQLQEEQAALQVTADKVSQLNLDRGLLDAEQQRLTRALHARDRDFKKLEEQLNLSKNDLRNTDKILEIRNRELTQQSEAIDRRKSSEAKLQVELKRSRAQMSGLQVHLTAKETQVAELEQRFATYKAKEQRASRDSESKADKLQSILRDREADLKDRERELQVAKQALKDASEDVQIKGAELEKQRLSIVSLKSTSSSSRGSAVQWKKEKAALEARLVDLEKAGSVTVLESNRKIGDLRAQLEEAMDAGEEHKKRIILLEYEKCQLRNKVAEAERVDKPVPINDSARDGKLTKIREDLGRVQLIIRAKDQQIEGLNRKLTQAKANLKDAQTQTPSTGEHVLEELREWKKRLVDYKASIEKIVKLKNFEIASLRKELEQVRSGSVID